MLGITPIQRPDMKRSQIVSERRTEFLLVELLSAQGWDHRRPPKGDLLLQQEYGQYEELASRLQTASKTGSGRGVPEAILLGRRRQTPAITPITCSITDGHRWPSALPAQGRILACVCISVTTAGNGRR